MEYHYCHCLHENNPFVLLVLFMHVFPNRIPIVCNVTNSLGIESLNTLLILRYILFLASSVSFWQAFFWLCFSPVLENATSFFSIDVEMINLLLNWGGIVYVIITIPTVILLSLFKDTLRVLMVTASALVAFGMTFRCLALFNPTATFAMVILNISMVINSMAAPLVMIFPPFLSATWFPDRERTKATAISALANSLGPGFAFAATPYIVNNLGIPVFLIAEATIAIIIFIMVLVYFPAKPPKAPSQSALAINSSKLSLIKELKLLISNPSFLCLVIAGGLEQGSLFGWSGIFSEILKPTFGEYTIGWIGFGCITGGCAIGVIIGALGDTLFKRKFKALLLIFWTLGFAVSLIFTLCLPNPFDTTPLFDLHPTTILILIIVCGSLLFGTNAIVLELAVELTYPVSEGTTAGMVTWILNGSMMVFLFVVPTFDKKWANTLFVGVIMLCLTLLLFVREKYNRLELDETNTNEKGYKAI
eukprot:TRINITY_DN4742_c0_g1_i2.p1 TRINITY_DN4742_c0_g1~~TRINITY_DN4742_c0_g1_i2.p1  ORF type:complete len:476 (+),score=55.04 TRINITY_DN4742_c0_g1_i2:481-1908(+)